MPAFAPFVLAPSSFIRRLHRFLFRPDSSLLCSQRVSFELRFPPTLHALASKQHPSWSVPEQHTENRTNAQNRIRQAHDNKQQQKV